jgi:predicted nuclease of restriction endonuclease-like RecB superfamily
MLPALLHVTRWSLTATLVPRRLSPYTPSVARFRLVHPDGRSFLLEIVGYWRPEYLRKKFAQVRRAGRHDLILAISERLNLERAGVKAADLPARVVWFKDWVLPKAVLEVLGE